MTVSYKPLTQNRSQMALTHRSCVQGKRKWKTLIPPTSLLNLQHLEASLISLWLEPRNDGPQPNELTHINTMRFLFKISLYWIYQQGTVTCRVKRLVNKVCGAVGLRGCVMHSPSPLAAPRQREHTTQKPGENRLWLKQKPFIRINCQWLYTGPRNDTGAAPSPCLRKGIHLPSRGCNCEHPGAWCACACMQVCVWY